jgi:hypothetical protein
MDRVSEAGACPRGPGRLTKLARLFAFAAAGVLALGLALGAAGVFRDAGPVGAQECPPGTIAFHFQFGVPTGTFDLGDLPGELPPEITIEVEQGTQFDQVTVVACIPEEAVQDGQALLGGLNIAFTTPTPGAPVRVNTPTNTPQPTATAPPAPPAPAPVTGIRPPSTGDAGLAGTRLPLKGDGPGVVVFALIAFAGGLAIGVVALVGKGRTTDSGRRRGVS